MPIPSVYINLEDDVSKIVARLKKTSAKQIILVCPKRCYLFNDSINLRLLKKQTDLFGKEIFILTMDERGQLYAKEAGFGLKFLPKSGGSSALSDVRVSKRAVAEPAEVQNTQAEETGVLETAVNEIKQIAKKIVPAAVDAEEPLMQKASTKTPKLKHAVKPQVKVTEVVFPEIEVVRQHNKPEKTKFFSRRVITGVTAFVLIAVLVLNFLVLPNATVVAYPKTEPVTRDMEINLSASTQNLDTTKLILPGTKVDETVNVNSQFQSQGKQQVGNKATGTVKIYNFTKLPINLKAQTTTLIVGSKTYSLVNDVMGLKPVTYINAKTKEVDPNSLGASIDVIASTGGEDFNLPAGTRMEITNQVFGSKPQFLYAKTDSEITGGTTRYLSIISQDDATAAQNQLQAQALAQIRDKLKTSGLALPEKSYAFAVSQFVTDNPVGAQTPSFRATLQAKLSGLAYKQGDLTNLILQRISQTLDTNKTLQPLDSNSVNVKVKSFDPVALLAVLTVHFQGLAIFDLNLPNISGELVGKSRSQADEILRSKAEIDKVEITIAPSWQQNFPLFASKIKVSVAKTAGSN